MNTAEGGWGSGQIDIILERDKLFGEEIIGIKSGVTMFVGKNYVYSMGYSQPDEHRYRFYAYTGSGGIDSRDVRLIAN